MTEGTTTFDSSTSGVTKEKRAEYNRRYKERHRESVRERHRKQNATKRKRMSAMVREMKSNTPCADCGVTYPYYVMDYDHLPGSAKEHRVRSTLASMPMRDGRAKILAEIAKCELVCSNCHRKRTWTRKWGTPDECGPDAARAELARGG